MTDLVVRPGFDVNPNKASVRLFFAKDSIQDTVWHICDAALGKLVGSHVFYMALHGSFMYATERADTILSADIQRAPTDRLCQRCLDEYILAQDIIEMKGLLRFD